MSDAPRAGGSGAGRGAGGSGAARRSPWASVPLWIAVGVTLLGAALWGYAQFSRARADAIAGAGSTGGAGLVSGFAARTGEVPAASPAPPRLIDEAAPATVRLGFSFLVGFGGGYLLRRFIKATAIVVAGGLILAFLAHRAGWLSDTESVRAPLEQASAWAQREASAIKDFLLGYVPSAAAGVAGLFFGFRSR